MAQWVRCVTTVKGGRDKDFDSHRASHTEGAPKYGNAIFQQVTVSLTARSCTSMLHGMELDVSGDNPLAILP